MSARRDEAGAILVFGALLLVVLLGVSALAIDIGVAKEHRRELQNGADAAALAGAQNLPDRTAATTQAEQYAGDNLKKFTLNWPLCADAPPAGYSANPGTPTSPCITFDTSFTRVRVRVPRQTFPSLFGKILNFSSTSTSTVATAQVRSAGNVALLPFVLFLNFTSGEACLDTGPSGGSVPPCNGPTAGNFGDLDFQQYGNPVQNTSASGCNNGGQGDRLSDNIAMGADHSYTLHPDGVSTGTIDCPGNPGPNEASQGTSNSSFFDEGILTGTKPSAPNFPNFGDGKPARFQRYPTDISGWETAATSSGLTVDNRPLWEFIPDNLPVGSGATGVPQSCQRETFDNLLSTTPKPQQAAIMHVALATCISDYVTSGSTMPVFTLDSHTESDLQIPDILESPRFSYVPQVWESDVCPGNSGGDCYHLKKFRAVFLQRLLGNGGKSVDFEPGPWNNNGSVQVKGQAEAVTAWVFPPSMLPAPLGDGPNSLGNNAFIQLVG